MHWISVSRSCSIASVAVGNTIALPPRRNGNVRKGTVIRSALAQPFSVRKPYRPLGCSETPIDMRTQAGPIRFSPLNSASNYFGRRFGRQKIKIFKQNIFVYIRLLDCMLIGENTRRKLHTYLS